MDLEMTGLDPSRHVIVEIATLLTDDDLNVIAEGPELVITATEAELAEMDDVVVEMHTTSGLLERIHSSEVTLAEATERAQEWIGFRDDAVVQVVEARRPCPVVRTVHADGHADVGPPPTQQGDFYRWLAWWKRRGA